MPDRTTPILLLSLLFAGPAGAAEPSSAVGIAPAGDDGRTLNLDFEEGTLRGWTAEGDAFAGQPVRGDTVAARRGDMKSRHQGEFWVGTYERAGDGPTGTLTSAPFRVTHPFASFLIAGGTHAGSRVELIRADDGSVIDQTSGDESEELKRVAVDLTAHQGRSIRIRLVDRESGGWGHLNFDDFRFHPAKPDFPTRAAPPPPDVYAHAGLAPEDAARAMTVPEGFRVTLFAGEPDVRQPIAFAIDGRGRLWVAEAYSYPIRVAPEQARDRILIFEDADGDGRFDTRKVFADKLNLVSGLEVGFGGVYVGAAPELLFIPDRDGDDRPDGPAQVLLDGWGYQDTHETLNAFTWGPDGWLYGCHGVFTHSKVGKPGTPDAGRTPINAGIWRYHPTRHVFEVFAHGTSNPWGVDFDAHGQAFLTACVIPHLYHVIPGARYERQAGPHFNPHTYDDIKTIADHRHYVGANPHGGNGRSDASGGGHAHAGAMIYLGGAWPAAYRGSIFMNNIHGARINRDTLTPSGSGFVGGHAPDFLLANDTWSQIINLKYGPDGQVYFIDWYDRQQCHLNELERHDRGNGRIFKVTHGEPKPVRVDLGTLTDAQLVDLQGHDNEWYARNARRVLQERGPNPEVADALLGFVRHRRDPVHRLRGLWALHAVRGLEDSDVALALGDDSPAVRGWGVRLAAEDGTLTRDQLARFAELAASDPSPVVRLELASALQRLPLADRWDILTALVAHAEDATDHNLPLMAWYAAEPLATVDAGRALRLAMGAKLPDLLPFMVRRVAALGTPEAIALLVEAVGRAEGDEPALAILSGLNRALQGRRSVAMPAGWPAVAGRLARSTDPRVRSQAMALALTFGDPAALGSLRTLLVDADVEAARRLEALAALLKARDPELPATLHALLADPALRGPALRGLAAFDHPATPAVVLAAYAGLGQADRRDALNTLAARVGYARELLAAVGAGAVPARDLSADIVRQLRNHKDAGLDAAIGKVWGVARDSTADKQALFDRYRKLIAAKDAPAPDASLGRAVFARVCQQCHNLFGTGGDVGPELTGSNRADLEYVLANVLDPSALIGNDYAAQVVATADGRVLTGILRREDADALTLVTANETVVIPRGDVEDRRPSAASMMPEDLWQPLTDHEVRSLVAYLASPSQVPTLATPDNLATLFNGRDLAGWRGDPALWSVEDGQIVGKTDGLSANAFLIGDLLAGDFRLTVQVKLVGDAGNSGLQFRSEPLPGGEVKGYQADVGPGWWGKLYEEHGRGLLWPDSGESHVRKGEWNTYEIVAQGSKIRTSLNGHPCVDLDDPAGSRRGIFALQLHSGGPTEVRFRDLKLELLPAAAPAARAD